LFSFVFLFLFEDHLLFIGFVQMREMFPSVCCVIALFLAYHLHVLWHVIFFLTLQHQTERILLFLHTVVTLSCSVILPDTVCCCRSSCLWWRAKIQFRIYAAKWGVYTACVRIILHNRVAYAVCEILSILYDDWPWVPF